MAETVISLPDKAGDQSSTAGGRKPKLPKGTIIIPCCRCIGAKGQIIRINSGSAAGSVPWNLAGPAGAVTNPIAQTITANVHPLWTASLSPAAWVQPNGPDGATNHPGGTYNYFIHIWVPRCTIPMKVEVKGEAAGDDEVRVYRGTSLSGGTLIGQTPTVADPPYAAAGVGGWGFRAARVLSFADTLAPGVLHWLRFEVGNGSLSPAGLLVRAAIRTTCSKDLELK